MPQEKDKILREKYPPSESCACEICRSYCMRPGWWTVEEAQKAIEAGYARRMMLELAPDFSFGVISPAFKGCEANFALQNLSNNGCNFYIAGKCELYDKGLVPLECRFCHHDRVGQGQLCHQDLEEEWKSPEGQALVKKWGIRTGLWDRYKISFKY